MSVINPFESVLSEEEQKLLEVTSDWMESDECPVAAYNTFNPVICFIETLCWRIKALQAQLDKNQDADLIDEP